MAVLQLRNHIPISGPARREPTNGTETDMRVSLGVAPDGIDRRLGVDCGHHCHNDPYGRHATVIMM